MSSLEALAKEGWRAWGPDYCQHGRCDNCGQLKTADGGFVFVRRSSRSRWLCLDCWDGGAR